MSHEINGVGGMNITVTDEDDDSCRMVVDRCRDGGLRLYVEAVTDDGCNITGDDLRALLTMLHDVPPRAPF